MANQPSQPARKPKPVRILAIEVTGKFVKVKFVAKGPWGMETEDQVIHYGHSFYGTMTTAEITTTLNAALHEVESLS